MGEPARKVKLRKRRRRPGEVFISDRIEYALLRALVFLLRALPVSAGSAVMGKAWRLIGPFTTRHRRALANLAFVLPELSLSERKKIAADQWENLGRTFAESFSMDRIVADPDRVEFEVSGALDEKLRAAGGQVIVSMHSGNWEASGIPARRYRSVIGLYQKLVNPLADRLVMGFRSNVFDGGVLPKGRATAARVTQWVREGNTFAMLGDHREERGIPVTMFGKPTLANPFPAMVARRLGVLLVAGYAVRLPGGRFRVQAVEIPVPATEDTKADVAAATQAIQDYFEAGIRERPGEWMWTQDRWGIDRKPKGARATGRRGLAM
jgi:KDO2-lipid IV(A) lauroyltransferase